MGRKIDIGGCRVFFKESGVGEPTVVLEAGMAGTSLSWAFVQDELAKITRVVSYDRAGLGWSDASNAPRSVEQIVSELRSMLRAGGFPPPYVLVGHSFGGIVIRGFAATSPLETAGLVFVDPVTLVGWANCEPNQQKRLDLGVRLSHRGALLARFGIVRSALAVLASGRTRIPRLVARTTAGKSSGILHRLTAEVKKLPPEIWPAVQAHWSRPKCFTAMARYMEALPQNARSALTVRLPPHIPIQVLSAENATLEELRERDEWVTDRPASRHFQVPGTGHWIQLERPDVIALAVQEVIAIVRQPGA